MSITRAGFKFRKNYADTMDARRSAGSRAKTRESRVLNTLYY